MDEARNDVDTFPKKKVEVIVEAAFADAVLDAMEREGAKGYTVIPHLRGKGHHGVRRYAGVSGVYENIMIVTICGPDRALRILKAAKEAIGDAVGIVYMSDVEVFRDEHF